VSTDPAAAPDTAVRPRTDGSFELWLVWSDVRLEVPAGVSALSVLLEAGVPVEPGCMTGGCGACATPYVEGEVVHKDACLSLEDRQRQFCPCVSRAVGTLAIPL
jgi:vanillate O-demethylase ferredoxin subunit